MFPKIEQKCSKGSNLSMLQAHNGSVTLTTLRDL